MSLMAEVYTKLMEPEQVVVAVQKYASKLKKLGFEPKRQTMTSILPNGFERNEHVFWMCGEVERQIGEGKTEKAMRWLGFIQGVLWAAGIATIDEMKDDNR